MRNLKKILALVLALVMTFSVMVTANAFTDEKDFNEDYAESIAILNGMGVFKGYEDGSFNPKGSITRAEVAAIIYRVVTADVKDTQAGIYADYNVFSDVPSTAWFAGYVNYCANAEYILGYGNGTFGPNDLVTGYQALAMILRAVGYDKMGEFVGATWQVQTAAVAKKLGITDGITAATLGAPATRELIAEVLFQTIYKAVQVDYTLAFGYSTRGNETLGVENFGLATADTEDDWGRPSTVWYGDNAKKGTVGKYDSKDTVYATFAETPIATYTVAATECDIAKDLGVKTTEKVDVYINGVEDVDYVLNALDTKTTLGGQGTLLEIYDEDHIVVIDTYLAQVGRYVTEKVDVNGHVIRDDYTVIDVWFDYEADTKKIDGAVDYAEDDYVLVYYNEKTEGEEYVEIVDAADSIVGAQTKYTTKASHIVEGEEYPDAAQFKHDEAEDKTTKYTWFFDQYGNLIGSFKIATTYTYGTISSIYWKDSNDGENGYALATITYIDGTSDSAKIAKIDGTTLKSGDSSSDYALGLVSETKQYNVDEFTNVALYEISEGSKGLELTETTYLPGATTETGVPALTDEIDAGNATQFLVWNGDEYETYTGIKNIPTYIDGDFWYVDTNNNKVVEYVFIVNPVGEDDVRTISYFFDGCNDDLIVTTNLKSSAIVSYTIEGGYVDGEPMEITTKSVDLKNEILDSGCTLLILTETNGYITDVKPVTDMPVKVDSLGAYVVYAGNAYKAVLDSTHDVLIDEFGYSYDIEVIDQIVCDEDLVDAIDKLDGRDADEYLYVVYKKGSKDTKIASLIYVTCTEGTPYVEETVIPNNLRKVVINGVEVTEIAGGEGSETDPYQVIATDCFNGLTTATLEVVALTTAQEIEIITSDVTGLGFAECDKAWPFSATNTWTFTIDGTYYVATIEVLSHDTALTVKTGYEKKAKIADETIYVASTFANEYSLTIDTLIEALEVADGAEAWYDADTKTVTVIPQCGVKHEVEYAIAFAEADAYPFV